MSLMPVRLALQTLRANPMRTTLSTLGIVMGAASLSAVLALGDGFQAYAQRRIEGEGLQTIALSARTTDEIDGVRVPRARVVHFAPTDMQALAAALGPGVGITLVRRTIVRWGVPAATPAGSAAVADRVALAQGVDVAGPLTAQPVQAGRPLAAADMAADSHVVVVSAVVARTIAGGAQPALGRELTIGARRLRVVGVLPDRADREQPLLLMPMRVLVDVAPSAQEPGTMLAQAGSVEDVEALKRSAEQWAHKRFPDGVTVAATGLDRLRDISQGILLFKLLMGAFTAIALLVGGIGIMNVLLASVLERTREIGVRRAVGARRRDIVWQFLAESLAISGTGSLVGLATGVAGAVAMTALMRAKTGAPVHAAVTLSTIAASAAVAVVTGLVFGLYPAFRAARLPPVDAIRAE